MIQILFLKISVCFLSLLFTLTGLAHAGQSLPLTLKDVIERVLKNNLSISAQSYEAKN